MKNEMMKGGSCGGASDYGMYVWGQNQTAGQGNIIQPANDPRLFGQPVTGGKRRPKIKGGSATISPALADASGLLDQSKISQIAGQSATQQMLDIMKPQVVGVNTDSGNGGATRGGARVTSRKNKRRSRKKIYSKNKKHNGRHKRRTAKIRRERSKMGFY